MTSIKDWQILNKLKPEFVANVSTVHVFDENAIFIITSSDCVYGFGANEYGSVGLGHTNKVCEPQRIGELCDKQVIKFAFNVNVLVQRLKNSSSCMNALALTKTGHIYSWGRNNSGQLGNGDTDDCFTPKLIESLKTIDITDVRCGGFGHCLALTFDGKIYSWGNNNYGQTGLGDRVGPHITPNQVMAVNAFKIVAIDCGYYHSLALTDDGFVYAFGDNELGQTGVGKKRTCFIPVRINLNNTRIGNISCGQHHCLLMSTDGDCYAFGNGQYGQIGDGNNLNKFVPIKIAMPLKCVDIAAINNTDISMVKLDDGFWRVWGKCCDDKSYAMPIKTDYQNVNEVIINFSCFKVSYEPIRCDNHCDTSGSVITARFIDSFDNPKYCDISFKIDDKVIHAQKQYLISVCRHFESMVSVKSGGQVIIEDYSYAVYYAFLKYLYTGSVDVKVEHLWDLIDLAKCYSEDELKEKCVQHIIKSVNNENVCTFCAFAIKYQLFALKEYCLEFVVKNFNLVKLTDGYKQTENTALLKLLNETFYNNI